MRYRSGSCWALALALAVPTLLEGQIALAGRASTLGIGAELSYRAGRNLGFRVGGNYLQFSRNATLENINYHVTPHFENGTAIVDLYPFGGSFHLSGGLLLNHNDGELVATLANNITIGDSTYTPQQVGSLTGTVTFNRTAPYFGLGFAGQSRIAFLFDLGVGVTGKPRIGLVGQTNLTGQAKTAFDNNVESERADVAADLDQRRYLRFHPVFSLGLKVRF